MKLGVVRFPGGGCDVELPGRPIAAADAALGDVDALVLLGGDARGAAILPAVKAFSDRGGPILAVCGGVAVACAAGLLEGRLVEASGAAAGQGVLRVEGRPTPFTHALPAGRLVEVTVAHAAARFEHPDPDRLEREARVVLRWVDAEGAPLPGAGVAAVTNARANVVGVVPHLVDLHFLLE